MGFKVEERPVLVDELVNGMKDGSLKEIFGAGTAAVVSVIRAFCYQDVTHELPVQENSMALKLKEKLTNIQYKLEDDPFGWTVKVG
jgi:branched-chain amino acid aminotransferase